YTGTTSGGRLRLRSSVGRPFLEGESMSAKNILAVLTMFVCGGAVGSSRPEAAQDDPVCPAIQYLGNYPQDEELNWSENIQGVAHDAGHWFFTQTGTLIQLPVSFDLHQDPPFK